MDYLVEALIAFGSTFAGVALGFYFALKHERGKKRQDDAEESTRALKSIRSELAFNLTSIPRDEKRLTTERAALKFSRIALESAVSSGGFALLDAETQAILMRTYLMLSNADMWVNKFVSVLDTIDLTKGESKQVSEFSLVLVGFWITLSKAIPETIKHIDGIIGSSPAS